MIEFVFTLHSFPFSHFPFPIPHPMLSLILSFIAFIVASYFIRRYLDQMEIPRTMTRGVVVFVLALGVSYGVEFLVGLL